MPYEHPEKTKTGFVLPQSGRPAPSVDSGPTRLKYLILSTPRSGSTMLAAALKGSGYAGVPGEYFHNNNLKKAGNPELYPNGLNTYFDNLLSLHTTANGVFGMKLHFAQFDKLFGATPASLSYGMAFLMQFDRFILISRQDKILQAISLIFAKESGIWNRSSESAKSKNGRLYKKEDIIDICSGIKSAVAQELSWAKLMQRLGIAPLEIVYETMCDDPETTFQRLKQYLRIPELNQCSLPFTTQKITDTQKAQDMKQNFLRDICLSESYNILPE